MRWDESRRRWVPELPGEAEQRALRATQIESERREIRQKAEEDRMIERRKYAVEWKRKDRVANPDKYQTWNRRANLKTLYGITPDQYDQMRAEQDYRCAICDRHEDEIPVKVAGRPRSDGSRAIRLPLVIDHCHTTDRLRKLLCDRCNHLLGHAREDIAVLEAAIKYLQKFAT